MSTLSDSVLPIIRSTREKLLPHYGNVQEIARKGEDAASAVTALDLEIEKYLAEELGKIDAGIAFAGEEFGGSRDAKRFWLCDPIDGTGHFIRGLPFCTVMVALIEEGQVNFGAIYDFVNEVMYHAERGAGAFANDTPIRVSKRPMQDAYLCYETHLLKKENLERFVKLREHASSFKAMCSGYEHALIASGKLEGRVNFDPWGQDYDYAPGTLLIEEAGGIVANLGKTTYEYQNLDYIAANPQVYTTLTEGPNALFPIA